MGEKLFGIASNLVVLLFQEKVELATIPNSWVSMLTSLISLPIQTYTISKSIKNRRSYFVMS